MHTDSAMLDGNEAVARVAYKTSEVIAIYPITPSSTMGELSDEWASKRMPNLWGTVPSVIEMQSEAGAAGAVHGALQTGSLATTFTSSQGLLLMVPNMFKIAGELTPAVIHVAARTVATHALSIFGDHSDVMSCRSTGWAMLCSASVQEAQDFALVAHAATLESRIPFLHFFDGFRTSHEVAKVELLSDEQIRAMIDLELVFDHRSRSLSPDHPVVRGTAQNPDVFFQAREASNPFYAACPQIVRESFQRLARITGRTYLPYEYHGAPDAERVIIVMGSACETVETTVDALGGKIGVLKVRLYRPFDAASFIAALPASVKSIAVLDRTKEPGANGEPLYLDVVNALFEAQRFVKVVGGRYGLSSKEMTPAMVKAVFDSLPQSPLPAARGEGQGEGPPNHFTIGINDDVSHTSIDYDPSFSIEEPDVIRALFYGLGADGTVGANKNSCKIIGDAGFFAQGYFVYDSKKSGAATVSHLRFGPRPVRAPYLISAAQFIACHQPSLIERYDMVKELMPGGTFLFNGSAEMLPPRVLRQLIERNARLYVIDATKVARESGMGNRINTIMQVCFFKLANVLPPEEALAAIRNSIRKSYAVKGEAVIEKNLRAVDAALENLHEVDLPQVAPLTLTLSPHGGERGLGLGQSLLPACGEKVALSEAKGRMRGETLQVLLRGEGDSLPVSALPCDGTFAVGTTKYEKRNIAQEIPVWDPAACIQCGKCAMVCPHAAIRIKVYDEALLAEKPPTFKSIKPMHKEFAGGLAYTIQVAPEDCTGCTLCVDVCPAKSKIVPDRRSLYMKPQPPLRDEERENWDFFLGIPELDRSKLTPNLIRSIELAQPLFEFSGACTGCGETPYLKLMTQLFGDRVVIANATGCSSIYGGNLPTTPWTTNADGRGPAWCNSLFEDNAEFGLGFRVSIDKQRDFARELLKNLAAEVGETLADEILKCEQKNEAEIFEQRARVDALKSRLRRAELSQRMHKLDSTDAQQLLALAGYLVKKSVWIVGGDGWAYDIGFGGLDHVLASGRNVNVLVLDTEVYSNTGGQASKATPRTAVAKFASGGKPAAKKDLGLIAMTYGSVYVASVAMGARDEHTLKALIEAEAYDGPSLIIAYSHCIAHGIDIATGLQHQKAMVDAGQWLLYRYHPEREPPLQLDTRRLTMPVEQFLRTENRFNQLLKGDGEESRALIAAAQKDVDVRWKMYNHLAAVK
ncbi:MAG TPA: pyruvate:ferredoxin (flavodoxin) oxidoreductase [Thermoanaerobaculia bacterium]|nr:pyruvate:ferredoxin (flavodoxin) oxidoreductase [Thermoanaerobaculia bacterium]